MLLLAGSALAVLAFAPAFAQSPAPTTPASAPASPPITTLDAARAEATARLEAFIAQRRVPGLSVAVGKDGQVLWAQGFGIADLETKQPVTNETVFPIGSTTKTLTALALGRLVDQGRIDLDAPIQKYVSYFPPKEFPITVRQLAGHLAGIRDYDPARGEYLNQKAFASIEQAVGVFKDDPLGFEPGTRHAYTAYGFVLLSAAIEGASGQDFLSFIAKEVLAPLGLTHTVPDRGKAAVPGLVTGYQAGQWGLAVPAAPVDVSNKWGAGGFVSTPTEMVRLGNAVLAGKVVQPATFELLTTPQKLKDGADSGAGYGMGWRAGKAKLPGLGREERFLHHGGLANGGMSFFALFPDLDLVVAIETNLLFQPWSEYQAVGIAVADLFAQVPAAAPAKPAAAAQN
jgi:serine beta-lactamase-like protein LACTB